MRVIEISTGNSVPSAFIAVSSARRPDQRALAGGEVALEPTLVGVAQVLAGTISSRTSLPTASERR